jgi:hypothetical protein
LVCLFIKIYYYYLALALYLLFVHLTKRLTKRRNGIGAKKPERKAAKRSKKSKQKNQILFVVEARLSTQKQKQKQKRKTKTTIDSTVTVQCTQVVNI